MYALPPVFNDEMTKAPSSWGRPLKPANPERQPKEASPTRMYGTDLFSEESLMKFSSSSYSPEQWDWFRFDSLQVGLLASAHASEPLTTRSLQVSKEALAAPPLNSHETVVGFSQCLPQLSAFLRRRMHAFPQARPPREGQTAFRNEHRTPENLSYLP